MKGVSIFLVSWYHNNVELKQSVKYMKKYIGDDYTFIINRVKVQDRGEFIIRAENHYGVSEEPVFLNVQAAPQEIKPYTPDPLPVRKREPKKFRNYQEERDSAPIFTFHLRPRIIQEGQTCKLLACATGQPHPAVNMYILYDSGGLWRTLEDFGGLWRSFKALWSI